MKIRWKILAPFVLLSSLLYPLAIYFPAVAESPKAGTYELILPGDAFGLYSMCETFSDLRMKNFQLSTTLDSYVQTTIDVDVKNLRFETTDEKTYHSSINGLKDFSVTVYGLPILYMQCGDADFDFIFSGNYHCLDIYGKLKGNVLFGMFIPSNEYEYDGPLLMIHIYIGGPYIRGDANKDGKVDMKDINSLIRSFGLCIEDLGYKFSFDFDFNGTIDMKDILKVVVNFGRTS